MNYETTRISKCCKALAVEYETWGDKVNTKTISGTYFMCERCKRACDTDEVCADCLGTREVAVDEDDGEGHTTGGVGTMRCLTCKAVDEDEMDDDTP